MSPAELRGLMTSKGLAAADVAAMVYASERAVFYWLSGDRTMPGSAAELLELKTAGMPDLPAASDLAADSM